MFTGVIAAGNVGQGGGSVFVCRIGKDFPRRILRRQRGGDAAHAPRAAEIQTVKMHELRICSVRDDGRL